MTAMFLAALAALIVLAVSRRRSKSSAAIAVAVETKVKAADYPYRAPQPMMVRVETTRDEEQAAVRKVIQALSTMPTAAPAKQPSVSGLLTQLEHVRPTPITPAVATEPKTDIVAMFYEQERQARILKAATAFGRSLNSRGRRRGGWGSW